jgi:BirA family biotin operon repressor/biotin-[acetyl-CoA-carboxylase] ligase
MERLFMGCRQIRLDSVNSTNNYTATLINGNAAEGTVVITHEQTAGRGQRGNLWISEPGKNLTCTYLLRPKFLRISDQFILNKAIALAAAKAIQQFIPSNVVHIKWPNDIFLQNKKVAGILVETSMQGGHIVSCLAGIGINVNQQQIQAESGNPISICEVLETELKLDDVLNALSENLEVLYLQLKAGKIENIDLSYNNLLWKKGETHSFYRDGIPFTAEVKCVDEQGCLHLIGDKNQELIFVHGAIQWF